MLGRMLRRKGGRVDSVWWAFRRHSLSVTVAVEMTGSKLFAEYLAKMEAKVQHAEEP